MKDLDELIFDYVRLVPLGMVTTFSEIAKAVGNNVTANGVANSLKKVQDITYIPTHRVVTSDGSMCKSFVDGGKRGQKKYLIYEGLVLKKSKVDLDKYGFRFW